MDKLNEGFLDSITMPISLSKYAFSMGFNPEKIANSSVDKLVGFVAVPWLKTNKKYVPTLRKLGDGDLETGLTKIVTIMQKNFSEKVNKTELSDSERKFLGESHMREADDDLLGYGEETDEPITDVYDGDLTGRPIGKHRLHPSEIDYAADSRELEDWGALDDPDAYAKDYPIAWRNEQAAAGPDLAEKEWLELQHKSCDTDTSNGMGGFYMNAYDYEEGNIDDGKDFYDVDLKESALFESILKGRK